MRIKQHCREFLGWWLHGCLALLPERWLRSLRHIPDLVTVEQRDNALVFRHYEGAGGQLREERAARLDDEAEKAAVNRWLTQREHEPDLVLLLPPDKQLEKRLTYPLSSERDLRAVLGFEMDKQTPFPSDKVCFDYTIAERDATGGQLHVNLYVVLREVLQEHLDLLGFLDLKPAAVTTGRDGAPDSRGTLAAQRVVAATSGGSAAPAAINFLPATDRRTNEPAVRRLKPIAVAALVLFFAALYLPLLRHGPVIAQLEEQVEVSRLEAMEAQALIDRKAAILRRAEFLSGQYQQRPPFILILRELTRRLPDAAWVQQLSIRADEIDIHGEAAAAASMIRVLEESDWFEQVRFRSPVTKNNATGKDQFHISAVVSAGAAQ